MATVRIDYTHKRGSHYNPHERIQGVAGDAGGGWYRSEDAVISDLHTGLNSYFVNVNGREVDVELASHQGREYIKTKTDDYAPNNLLALQEPPTQLLP